VPAFAASQSNAVHRPTVSFICQPCRLELAGASAAAAVDLAQAAVDKLLLPLLNLQAPPLPAARCSELAGSITGLLLALRMWPAAARLIRVAASAACHGFSGGGLAAGGSHDADAAAQAGAAVLSVSPEPAAADTNAAASGADGGLDEQLLLLEAQLTSPGQGSGAAEPEAAIRTSGGTSADGHAYATLPAEAALPLLCQLVAAAAEAACRTHRTPGSSKVGGAAAAVVETAASASPAAGGSASAIALAAAGARASLEAARALLAGVPSRQRLPRSWTLAARSLLPAALASAAAIGAGTEARMLQALFEASRWFFHVSTCFCRIQWTVEPETSSSIEANEESAAAACSRQRCSPRQLEVPAANLAPISQLHLPLTHRHGHPRCCVALMLRDAGLAGGSRRRIALACLVTLAPRLAAAEVAFGEDAGFLRLVRAAMVGNLARNEGTHAAMSPIITACCGCGPRHGKPRGGQPHSAIGRHMVCCAADCARSLLPVCLFRPHMRSKQGSCGHNARLIARAYLACCAALFRV